MMHQLLPWGKLVWLFSNSCLHRMHVFVAPSMGCARVVRRCVRVPPNHPTRQNACDFFTRIFTRICLADTLFAPNLGASRLADADRGVGTRAMACTSRQPVTPSGVARLARAGETRRVRRAARPKGSAPGDLVSPNPASRLTNSRVAPSRAAADALDTGSVDEGDAAIDNLTATSFDPRGNPATVQFAPLPDDTSAVCWRDHMEFLFQTLDRSLGPLTPVHLPPELASASVPGKVRSETWVYTSPFVRRARFTYVDGGEKTQIFNCVVYPRCADDSTGEEGHLGDAPLLGVDLLSLNGGKKILVGVDLQPLSRSEAYLGRYVDALASLRDARFAELNLVEPSDRFYEDAQFFSPAMLFARPVPVDVAVDCAVAAAKATGAMQDLGAITAEDVCGVEWAEPNSGCGVPLVQAKTLDAVKAYAAKWLELMDARNDDWAKAWDARQQGRAGGGATSALGARAGSFSQLLADNIKSAVGAKSEGGEDETAADDAEGGRPAPPAAAAEEPKRAAERAGKYARVLTAAESAAAQDFHDMWQRSHDPAIPMFAGWFGKEWAERLASEVLFPEDKAKEELKAWEAQQRGVHD